MSDAAKLRDNVHRLSAPAHVRGGLHNDYTLRTGGADFEPIDAQPKPTLAATDVESFPTPADIAKGTVTPISKHGIWPPR